ncbi:MAG: DUF4198 domain-containing protein [Thermodesulfobacteriota bacterium]
MKRTWIILALMLLFPLTANAHMFWLLTDKDSPKVNEPVQVEIGFGHKFPRDEEIKAERLGAVQALSASGKKFALKKISTSRYEFLPPAPGVYCLTAQMVPDFVTRTPQGMKMQKKKGIPDANYCFHFDMAAKTLVNVGGQSQGFDQRAKNALEVLPLRNPASLKTGASLPLKVLFQGKPLPEATVKITNDSWSNPKNPFVSTGKTDGRGECRVKADKPGKWLIVVSHKTPYTPQDECDDNFYSASLTFTVR